jgi:translation initiation factor IF-2
MGKVKVHELAKNMGLESKDLLVKLVEAGVDVTSHANSLAEEDLRKFEDFINPPKQKIEEALIKPGIIRRRRTVVREPVAEAPVVADSAVSEPSDGEEEPSVTVENPAEETQEHSVKGESPEAAEDALKLKGEVREDVDAPHTDVISQATEDSKALKATRKADAVTVEEPTAPPKKNKKPSVEKATSDRAKILGRVELPPAAPTGQRKPRAGERPARQDRKPARPGATPSTTPGARPATTPSRGNKRVDPAPLAPLEKPFLEKEGRNKKRTKSRRAENTDASGGLVSRRGRRVEVFEPGRAGQKKKRGGKHSKQSKQTEVTLSKAIKRVVRISDSITVGELAKKMGVKAKELISELMRQGSMVTINHPLDFESAALLASEFNHEVENVAFDEVTILELEPAKETEDKSEDLETRPPVVTIMGHVDHGKTSLLDAIREANVTAGEAGGITQHIGAYDVELDGRKVTFLDTPGHEAFTAMRARGAGVTDIVILVVAADDGVMPQTKEAISHSKAAGVPIIIAINKIDKPDSNPERVKQELTEYELVPEEWGGDTIFVEVSAKQHTNLDTLLEMVLLQAEVLELKANPNKRAKGSIVEARLDKGRGPIATVLVQDGTLKIGDAIVAGLHFGRVRSMITATGSQVKEAGPSFPVEVTGLGGVPNAGDSFHAVENEKAAKEVSQHRQSKQRETDLSKHSKVSLEQLFAKMQEGVVEELAVIIKADVQGSVEAVRDALEKLSTDACRLNVLHTGVGGISESDITLATASNAIVLGFNVRPESKAKMLADVEKVDIRLYSVIYDAVSDIRDAMEGLLAPTLKENELGRVEVRDTFHVTRVGTIAGCYVVDGKIVRNAKTRLIRDNVVVWHGKLSSLKRFKDDAKEVASGYECGIGLDRFNDIKVGDIIEVFEIEEVKTTL